MYMADRNTKPVRPNIQKSLNMEVKKPSRYYHSIHNRVQDS